eukprot:138976-Chlamydomonas_euryale.AAC.1
MQHQADPVREAGRGLWEGGEGGGRKIMDKWRTSWERGEQKRRGTEEREREQAMGQEQEARVSHSRTERESATEADG